jgi:hypothetical protein
MIVPSSIILAPAVFMLGCGGVVDVPDGSATDADTCLMTCGLGLVCCSGECVSLRNDPFNCGGCGHRCDKTQVCTFYQNQALGHCGDRFCGIQDLCRDSSECCSVGCCKTGCCFNGVTYDCADDAGRCVPPPPR